MRHALTALQVAALALAIGTSAVRADPWVTPFRGHVSFGYSKLLSSDAPGGSLGFSVGVDRPLSATLRTGVDIDYSLLGTRTIERGSLVADVDYSAIEALAMLHWQPSWPGPLGRLSAGAGVMGARAAVSSAGAAEFQDLAVSQVSPALAVEATLLGRHPAPVRVGLETGYHLGFLSHQSWSLWDARLAIHY